MPDSEGWIPCRSRKMARRLRALLLRQGRTDAESTSRARIHLASRFWAQHGRRERDRDRFEGEAVKSVLSFAARVAKRRRRARVFLGARASLEVRTTQMETRPQSVSRSRLVPRVLSLGRSCCAARRIPSYDAIESRPSQAKPIVRSLPAPSQRSSARFEAARRALTRRDMRTRCALGRVRKELPEAEPPHRSHPGAHRNAHRIRTDCSRTRSGELLAKHPNGPYARRVRSLLTDAAPTVRER